MNLCFHICRFFGIFSLISEKLMYQIMIIFIDFVDKIFYMQTDLKMYTKKYPHRKYQ